MASLTAEHGLQQLQLLLQRRGSVDVALGLSCMWELPGSGVELVSPALSGRFFTTKLGGKALMSYS